jgi:hypothetical protein
MSPEIASKSLSALQDRKQEIISELKEIVGRYQLFSTCDVFKNLRYANFFPLATVFSLDDLKHLTDT